MRDILFRGKTCNGRWVEGFYVKAKYHYHKFGIHEDYIITGVQGNGGWLTVLGRHAVIPETVGQYTGLTDKNGTRIFEGDIMRLNIGTYPCLVYFDGRGFAWLSNGRRREIDLTREKMTIIGNIHDNPELLPEEAFK